MIKTFFNDNSGFKNRILFLIILTIIFTCGSVFFANQYAKKAEANNKLAAQYSAERKWLETFDEKTALSVNEKLLKPVTEDQLEKIQQQQLGIFEKNGVIVVSAQKSNVISDKKSKLKAIKVNANLVSSWNDIISALNEFETNNLVVITNLDMWVNKSGSLSTDITYNIFYQ